jgi:hypothetical protein
VHQVQVDHHGYTFPYDDVKPSIMVDGDEVSGSIATEGVRVLRVIVGGTQQADSAPASEPESSSVAIQSHSTPDTNSQDTESSTTTSDTPNGDDSSTYATKSPDASDTSTPSSSAVPASLESLATQVPTTLVTLPSTTSPAHPGDSPSAYSLLAGATTKSIPVVTIIETAVVTTYVTTTTTLLV